LVDKLSRDFEVSLKKEGFWGGLSSFFRPEKKIIRALDKISFSLEEGELVGFIGPNGAGKTTTLKFFPVFFTLQPVWCKFWVLTLGKDDRNI